MSDENVITGSNSNGIGAVGIDRTLTDEITNSNRDSQNTYLQGENNIENGGAQNDSKPRVCNDDKSVGPLQSVIDK
jgi:hypothetical protein